MRRALPPASDVRRERHPRLAGASFSRGSVRHRMGFRTIALTSAAMGCFSANSILCRLALAPHLIDPATFTTVRGAPAAAVLRAVIWLRARRLPGIMQTDPFLAAALLGYLFFFSFAYVRLDAGPGALILIGAVQFTMFTIAFWEGERFAASQWVGLSLALLGFVYLVLPGLSAPDALGAVLMTMCGVSWGFFSLLARRAGDPLAANTGNFLWCLLPAVAVNLFDLQQFQAAPAGLLLAVASGAIATGFGYVIWYRAIRDLPASHAATVQLSMPALVAL